MSYKNNAISSVDPKAIEKLTEKLHKCEKEQEFMKNVNAYYKKNGTTKGCEGISDELAAKLDTRVQEAYSWDMRGKWDISKKIPLRKLTSRRKINLSESFITAAN